MRKNRLRLYGRDEPAFLRCSDRRRSRGCVWAVLQSDRLCGPVLRKQQGPISKHRRESYRPMPRPGKRAMVRPDGLQPYQLVRPVGAVRNFSPFSLFRSGATGSLTTIRGSSFDLCQDSGAPGAFFPSGNGALTGTYQEVPCTEWSGTDGSSLWNGACLAEDSIGNWPTTGCGNQGAELSPRKTFLVDVKLCSRHCTLLNEWGGKCQRFRIAVPQELSPCDDRRPGTRWSLDSTVLMNIINETVIHSWSR